MSEPSSGPSPAPPRPTDRLVAVELDEGSIGRGNPDQEHERAIAIYDIVEKNVFAIPGHPDGPYRLRLAIAEKRLVFEVSSVETGGCLTHHLSLSPFRSLIRDYQLVCDSYYQAIRTSSPTQIEAIDMGRRGLHDEASTLLMERLDGKVALDFDTARRLFTLIFALHWRG